MGNTFEKSKTVRGTRGSCPKPTLLNIYLTVFIGKDEAILLRDGFSLMMCSDSSILKSNTLLAFVKMLKLPCVTKVSQAKE